MDYRRVPISPRRAPDRNHRLELTERWCRELGQLGIIAWLMLPPSAGGHWLLYLAALGQTLSIACLGTVLAAVLAFAGRSLAARNVVANWVLHVMPLFVSQVLYYFESNTRSATIIGIVGAGGIGLHLFEAIRVLECQLLGAADPGGGRARRRIAPAAPGDHRPAALTATSSNGQIRSRAGSI